MTQSDIETNVRAFYNNRLKNDLSAILPDLAPNIRFRLAGSAEASPVPCDCKGMEEASGVLALLIDNWDFMELTELSLTIQDNRAVVQYLAKIRFVPLDEVVETEVLDIVTFDDGKVVDFVQFVDTAMTKNLADRHVSS